MLRSMSAALDYLPEESRRAERAAQLARDQMAAQIAKANAGRDRLIRKARDEGATWPAIAAAAGMSRTGVINAYRRTSAQESPDL